MLDGRVVRSHASFGTTSWTVLRLAASGADWEGFVRCYRKAIIEFFRTAGWSESDAEDLAQGFIAREIETRRVVAQADPARGRFRVYLRVALRNYARDQVRARHGRDGRRREVLLDALQDGESHWSTAEAAFDRQWATAAVERAWDATREACEADGHALHLALFDARVVGPTVRNLETPSVDALGREYGLAPTQVSSMIFSVKRKFRRALMGVVSETLENANDVEQEIQELDMALAAPMPG